ncbi:MAG: hypothetical protein QM451_08270 [Bacillota bacterium]|nr:hypothetical protein [Bacillota bacterium]
MYEKAAQVMEDLFARDCQFAMATAQDGIPSNDQHMCYLKIELVDGFFYQDGMGYAIDFSKKTARSFPFEYDIVPSL